MQLPKGFAWILSLQEYNMQHIPKHLTHEDVEFFNTCELQYDKNRQGQSRAPITVEQRVAMACGRAHHKASAATDSNERSGIIAEALARVPAAHREAARLELTDTMNHSQLSAQTEDFGFQREKQLLWLDPKTGWTFASKPDLYRETDDRISIKEEKRSKRFYDSHRGQVWFAGFVAARIDIDKQAALPVAERRYKLIDLWVRCSRFINAGGRKRRMWERKFRYPIFRIERETWFLRELVKKIMRREKSNYFVPALKLSACATCPFRGECGPLSRNKPLIEQVKAEEARSGRPTAFVEVTAIAPASSATIEITTIDTTTAVA
jgi:hypothetical protein